MQNIELLTNNYRAILNSSQSRNPAFLDKAQQLLLQLIEEFNEFEIHNSSEVCKCVNSTNPMRR